MALRFIDGFDHYSTDDLSLKYGSYSTATIGSYGRFGNPESTGGLRLGAGGYFQKTIDDQSTWVVGFAFKDMAFYSSPVALIRFYDSASAVQMCVSITSAGLIAIYRGDQTTLLATSTAALTAGEWYFIECKLVISDSSGTIEVKVDDTSVVSYSGDTQASATLSTAQKIRINQAGSGSSYSYFDDLYICDGTGTTNLDFLGLVRVRTVYPKGAGNSSQFTGVGDVSNLYANVSEVPANGDTSYNYSSTAGNADSFPCSPIITPFMVYGISVNLKARKDDSNTRTMATRVRSGGTDYDGTTKTLTSSYATYSQIYETNPNTSAAWADTELNAAEFGYKMVA